MCVKFAFVLVSEKKLNKEKMSIDSPDLGGAPMPGTGLDLNFLKSLEDDDGRGFPGTPQLHGNREGGAPPSIVEPEATRKVKPNIQPMGREDYSAEAMERRYESQKEKQERIQREHEAQMAAEQAYKHQVALDAAKKRAEENLESGESIFVTYQVYALWIGVVALLLVVYFLYKRNNMRLK